MQEAEDQLLPVAGNHRGVSLFADQPAERIESVVRPAIDIVFGMTSPSALVDYASDPRHPPEARLLAAARVEAFWEIAAESRVARPVVVLARLRASVAGLDSCTWVDPRRYGSLLDPDGAVERAEPLPADEAARPQPRSTP